MEDGTQALLTAAGAVLLIGGVFIAIGVARARLRRGWVRTEGEVVGRRPSRHGNGYHPTFRWWDGEGREHQRTSAVHSTLGARPGRQVEVLYDPNAPERAMIDSIGQRGTLFTIIGGLLACVAGGLAALAFTI